MEVAKSLMGTHKQEVVHHNAGENNGIVWGLPGRWSAGGGAADLGLKGIPEASQGALGVKSPPGQ